MRPSARARAWLARSGLDPYRALLLLPAAVFFTCSVSADLVAIAGRDPIGIWRILPAGPVGGGWLPDEVSSTGLLLVSIALLRAKRSGFWLALAALAGAVVVQGVRMHHPVAAVIAIALAALLLVTHREYDVLTGPRETRAVLALLAAGTIAVTLGVAALDRAGDAGMALAAALGGFLDLATPVAVPGLAAVAGVLVAARLAYVLATVLVLDPAADDRSSLEVAGAAMALRRHGRGSLLPYQLGPACVPFADDSGEAAMAVATAGRAAVALGDPAGDEDAASSLFDAWVARCRRQDRIPVVYQASDALRRRLEGIGWHGCIVGREAIVDPVAFDLRSPRVANVRHTVTRSRRGGLQTIWRAEGLGGFEDPALVAGLVALDSEWRRRAGPELGFTVGRFDPNDASPAGIAVAVDASGAPAAFVVVRPTGADGGWMLDLMRRAEGSVPGGVEACVVAAIDGLATMGVTRLSLGLAPLSGLDAHAGSAAERALAIAARLVQPMYDTRGLAFFKDKFGPRWEARHLVAQHRWQLLTAAIALLRLHLGGSWPRVVRSLATSLRPPARLASDGSMTRPA